MHAPGGLRMRVGVSPPSGRRLGFSEVSGRRAAVPTAGPAQSPSPRFSRCPLRTPFPAPFEAQPSFGPSGAGKWLSGVPGAAQGHPERRLSPCRRRGLLLGLPAAGGLPAVYPPPLAPRGPRGRFQLPGGSQGCWGLESPHGGVLGPPRGIRSGGSPRRAGSPPGSSRRLPAGPPFGSPEARRAVLSPRAVLEALESGPAA